MNNNRKEVLIIDYAKISYIILKILLSE